MTKPNDAQFKETFRMCNNCMSLLTLRPPVKKATVVIGYTAVDDCSSLIYADRAKFEDIIEDEDDFWN